MKDDITNITANNQRAEIADTEENVTVTQQTDTAEAKNYKTVTKQCTTKKKNQKIILKKIEERQPLWKEEHHKKSLISKKIDDMKASIEAECQKK